MRNAAFFSSLPPDPKVLASTSRVHWSIENNLHRTLDVAFIEDQCRIRKDQPSQNMAMIRRLALDMLKQPKKYPSNENDSRLYLTRLTDHKSRKVTDL